MKERFISVSYTHLGAETVALLSKPETYFISSSAVRELIEFRADISDYVPKEVADMINGGNAK